MKLFRMITVLAYIGLLFSGGWNGASAEEAKLELKNSQTMKEILHDRVGKRVALRMQSGEDIDGTVVMVGEQLVQISKLTGKEFYDAIVSIDRINAVIIKAR